MRFVLFPLLVMGLFGLGGCYSGTLVGEDGSSLKLTAGLMVVCETPQQSLAAFAFATSYAACPHEDDTGVVIDTGEPVDTGPVLDTADTGDTGMAIEDPDEETDEDRERGLCGLFNELFSEPAFCQPWRVQVNFPARAHTLNTWFEEVPERDDLLGIQTSEAILAHCPDPANGEPAWATELGGSLEVVRDSGRKVRVRTDTDKAGGLLKFKTCR